MADSDTSLDLRFCLICQTQKEEQLVKNPRAFYETLLKSYKYKSFLRRISICSNSVATERRYLREIQIGHMAPKMLPRLYSLWNAKTVKGKVCLVFDMHQFLFLNLIKIYENVILLKVLHFN